VLCSHGPAGNFNTDVVAFIDEDIELAAIEQKAGQIFLTNAFCIAFNGQKRVYFRYFPGGNNAFIDSYVMDSCAYPVEITEFDGIKIGQFQFSAGAFGGHGKCNRMAYRQSNDADRPCG
jgi:hypothetical protein